MNQQQYDEWLNSLQVGDEVTYHNNWHGDVITKIITITPKRQIKTENGCTFKNGRYRIDSWTSYQMFPVTEEIKNRIRKRALFSHLGKVTFAKLSLDQLERIKKIIDEGEETNK